MQLCNQAWHPLQARAFILVASHPIQVRYGRPTADARHTYVCPNFQHTSYHVFTGQLPRVIETLERGRTLIWSEMRGLRTSSDRTHTGLDRLTGSHLADKFAVQ